jgi:Na+/proline symporter
VSSLGGGLSSSDWLVVIGVFALATAAAVFGAKRGGARGFFLGRREVAWWAASLSIVATEIGSLALVAIPALVFAPGGSFAFLQLVLVGSVLARFVVAWWIVPAYFEREFYSPYEYIEARLGRRAGALSTAIFALGGALVQAARLFLAASVIDLLLHDETSRAGSALGGLALPPVAIAMLAIGGLGALWALIGGIGAVVWADVVLLAAFVAAAIAALCAIAANLDIGFARVWQVGVDAHKIDLWSFSASPVHAYTFWAAAIASSWGGIGAYGVDQTLAQRILCCRSVRDARKAVLASSLAVLVAFLVAFIGVALFAYYEREPLQSTELELLRKTPEAILPIFVANVVQPGWRGLIVAGMLAAAAAAFAGIVVALGQAAFAEIDRRRPGGRRIIDDPASTDRGATDRAGSLDASGSAAAVVDRERRSARTARFTVLACAVGMCAFALLLARASQRYGAIRDLSLSMGEYTQGALLAAFALAYFQARGAREGTRSARDGMRVDATGFLWSAPLAIVAVIGVAWHGPRSEWITLRFAIAFAAAWIALRSLPDWFRGVPRRTVAVQAASVALAAGFLVWIDRFGLFRVEINSRYDPEYDWLPLSWPWYVPVGSTVAFVFGVLLARPDAKSCSTHDRDARAPALEQ